MSKSLNGLYPSREIQSITYLLLEHRLESTRTQLLISEDAVINSDLQDQLLQDLELLRQSMPVQYVIGHTWFMDMKFKVNPSVLIPRPETEELVRLIIRENTDIEPNVIVDVCSGSGCIAIALKAYFRNSGVRGIEISEAALNLARINESALLISGKIEWAKQDVLKDAFLSGDESIVVSNPPYIPPSERNKMSENVLKYEPEIALFTPGNDPLIFYRRIVRSIQEVSSYPTKCYFECHEDFADDVCSLFDTKHWEEAVIIRDLQGKARMVRSVLIKR